MRCPKVGRILCLLALLFRPVMAFCQATGPDRALSGTVRIWGDPAMRTMLEGWEQEFRARHPQVRFENRLFGTVTAIAAVDHDVAQIAAMGRELGVEESMSFEWIYRYKPLSLKVSSGSLRQRGALPALAILVNRANPVNSLTLDQVRTIFLCCRNGADRKPVWGDVGSVGNLTRARIHPLGYPLDRGVSAFFREHVLRNSYQWSCDYRAYVAPSDLIRSVTSDPAAIAVGTLADASGAVKVISLVDQDGIPILPDLDTVREHSYPLARYAYLIVNPGPEQPLDAATLAFLRYVLNPDGQAAIEAYSSFLPLPKTAAAQERKKLDTAILQSKTIDMNARSEE